MKTLLLLIAPLTGCIMTTEGQGEEVGFINTEWSFHSVEGAALDCPAGFPTVEVTAIPFDRSLPAFIDLYSCNRQQASAPYPIGEYEVTIAITNNSGSEAYAHSLSRVVDLFSADASVGEDFIHDGGRILFDWVLVDAETNADLECRTAGNPKAIKVEAASSDAAFSTELTCGDGFGVSNPLLAGAYQATFSVINQAGQPLGEPQTKAVALRDRNDYDDVGTITLPIGAFAPPPSPPQ